MTAAGRDGALATVVKTSGSVPRHAGTKMICTADGQNIGTVGGGLAEATIIERAQEVISSGECAIVEVKLTGEHGVCGGTMSVFLEPIHTSTPFFVIGAGHVGAALANLGSQLRFRFTLVDDRPEFLESAKSMPGVGTILAGPIDLPAKLVIPPRAAVVVCSRGVDLDGQYLAALLRLEIAQGQRFEFFGSLGSSAKAAHLKTFLRGQEDVKAQIERIRLPVGMDLGAETPGEIALSILAEAQAVIQGVQPMPGRDGGSGFRCLGEK
ncbi:MAG: xanthine dehydrogenase accessory factor [Candidatus Krumholzibacteriia bacterium]|jgi:xanthine dehydrogenase accessory factor